MNQNKDLINQHKIISRVLTKKIFEMNFLGFHMDELEKEDLASIANEQHDKINKLKDPRYTMTSRKLVMRYLRDCHKFPKLQAKLLKFLSINQDIDKKKTMTYIYGHKNDNPESALRKLVENTNKTIKKTDSGDVFHVASKGGILNLNVTATHLPIILKKRSRKITT